MSWIKAIVVRSTLLWREFTHDFELNETARRGAFIKKGP